MEKEIIETKQCDLDKITGTCILFGRGNKLKFQCVVSSPIKVPKSSPKEFLPLRYYYTYIYIPFIYGRHFSIINDNKKISKLHEFFFEWKKFSKEIQISIETELQKILIEKAYLEEYEPTILGKEIEVELGDKITYINALVLRLKIMFTEFRVEFSEIVREIKKTMKKMKISKECKEQIKKLLEEFFECNIDEIYTEILIYYAYHKNFDAFDYLIYNKIWKYAKLHYSFGLPKKLAKIFKKYCQTNETKKLYNKITTLIAYHNKDYNYLASKITNLLSSL